MPPGILRSLEAVDAAMVHVHAVREPDQDQNLSGASSRRRLNAEAALFADASQIEAEQSSHIEAIKQTLTIQGFEHARGRTGMLLASSIGVAQSRN